MNIGFSQLLVMNDPDSRFKVMSQRERPGQRIPFRHSLLLNYTEINIFRTENLVIDYHSAPLWS